MNDPFKFDPNSTINEGRWRLIDPEKFIKGPGWFRKKNPNYPGVSYVFGRLKEGTGKTTKQTIRFDKSIFTEEKAGEWWEEHKDDYDREWDEEDWNEWVKKRDEKVQKEGKKQKPKDQKITRRRALLLSKKLIELFGAKYVPQKEITIDTKYKKNIGFPAGSVRQGKEEVGDLDIVLTKNITRTDVEEMGDKNIINITNLTGKDKFIKFVYHFGPKGRGEQIGVDMFIFKDKETWGAALLHTTGPHLYNIYIRKKVKSFGEGWSLSQNGLVNGFDEIIPTPTERSLQKEIEVRERTPDERKEFRKK